MAQTLPFAFNNLEENQVFDKAVNRLFMADILEKDYNQVVLQCFAADIHTYCGTKPCKVMSDWKGKLIWVANSMEADAVVLLGGTPVSLGFMDGYPALQKKTVDAGMTSLPAILKFRWYDVIKYVTNCEMCGSMSYVTMNKDFYNKLPADIKQMLTEECAWFETWLPASIAGEQYDAESNLPLNGVNIYDLPKAEKAKWREVCKPIYDKYYQQIGPTNTNLVKQALAEVASATGY